MKLPISLLFLALAVSGSPAMAADSAPVTKVIILKGIANGKVCIEGLAGTYHVDEDFPDNRHISITGREVYVTRVNISQSADSTLNISVNLPSWLKTPTNSDLQVSISGSELTSLTLSRGSDIEVEGLSSTPRSLAINVKGRSRLLFNSPVKTSAITASVSTGSILTINRAKADNITMTLSENSQGYISGATVIAKLLIKASGGSTAFVANSSVNAADFDATDMSRIDYNIKPRIFIQHSTRGGLIKRSNEIPKDKGLL